MNIDTLIKTLESAAELATDGKWTTHMLIDAQAIAIRHNTARDVIRYLKDVHWTNAANHEYGESTLRLAEMVKTQRARADRAESLSSSLNELFLRVSEAAGLELFESPTVVLGEVKNLRARTDEARAIINELAFCIDPNAIGDAATELFARAEKYLTEPTPPEATP